MKRKTRIWAAALSVSLLCGCAGQSASPTQEPVSADATFAQESTGQESQTAQESTGQTGSSAEGQSAGQDETAADATNAQQSAAAEEDVEMYESVPYRLYPTSENAWVGDVMPMAEGDTLHLYYLYDTDHNGSGYHPIYKFSTTNFYEYQDDGLMVDFGKSQDDPDLAVGTGSVLIDADGRYHCFYTGHNDTFPEKGKDKECVMHAVSEDNQNWTKIPEDTFYAPDGYSGDDFRDPFVFWNEDDGCYWLLIAARDDSLGGIVARFTSTDLSKWTLAEPLYAPKAQYMLECPDLFRMGDWYYLFYSWDCVTYYARSKSINGPFEAPEDNVLDGTGFCFYAAKTAELGGNRYLCGWIGRKKEPSDASAYDWAGSLLIHQLVQKEDGTLGVREPERFGEYFASEETPQADALYGTVEETENGYRLTAEKGDFSLVTFGMRKPEMMAEFTVTFSEGDYAGLAFGPGDEYGKYTGVVLDAKTQSVHYEGCVLSRIQYVDALNTTRFAFEPGKSYHIKVVMENEIVIVYIDDTKALSNRIYKSVDGMQWGLYASGADVTFEDIRVSVH